MKAAVIGAGSWGTTLAAYLARRDSTVLWGRDDALVRSISDTHQNVKYLPDIVLPEDLAVTGSLEIACAEADLVIFAVPSHGMREIARAASPYLHADIVLSVAKGIEQESLKRMTQVLGEEVTAPNIGTLTGPNLAHEIASGQPAASVVGFTDLACAERVQELIGSTNFRLYNNTDVVGCELAGALKNVMAIAVGVGVGMGFGDNARAAMITRGLAELARLGVALGGDPLTFAGLAGMGDLIVTCTSPQSRNRQVGYEIGRGIAVDEILSGMTMVAEGVRTTAAVLALAEKANVDMPIARAVAAVLYEKRKPGEVLLELLAREAKSELPNFR